MASNCDNGEKRRVAFRTGLLRSREFLHWAPVPEWMSSETVQEKMLEAVGSTASILPNFARSSLSQVADRQRFQLTVLIRRQFARMAGSELNAYGGTQPGKATPPG